MRRDRRTKTTNNPEVTKLSLLTHDVNSHTHAQIQCYRLSVAYRRYAASRLLPEYGLTVKHFLQSSKLCRLSVSIAGQTSTELDASCRRLFQSVQALLNTRTNHDHLWLILDRYYFGQRSVSVGQVGCPFVALVDCMRLPNSAEALIAGRFCD